ncbi:histidine-rich glycoprotein [Tupaia chinensis]|uniref:Histidine-rich glycoprotein n=1 Tax=Tupaia chinensis TaxID=246437 RepID=L8XZH1_TUPCH|nr:histidine-rich glycoprotein [Tupaia chinensis]ELV09448.1 Histidine-rich glycoprotein [Tupaia chinensis]
MKVLTAALLLITLQYSCALSPTDCDATEPVAEKALDLINKGRRNGYLFELWRVADAHLDKADSATVYYLVLEVKESDCSVLSRKHWDDCKLAYSRRPSEIVIGQCKVIAIRHSNESQDLSLIDYNCTTSSVSPALTNTKDSPVLFDFFENTEPYRKKANEALEKYKKENSDFASFRVDQVERVIRARGGERTGYYVDFSVRNCSKHRFPRYPRVFGFCRAHLIYDAEASDLETPENLIIDCEVFDLEEFRNISDVRPHLGHRHHSGEHEHSWVSKPPFKPGGFRDHHPPRPHKFGCPPPPEDKDHPDRLPPSGSRCHHPPFGIGRTQGPPHNHSSSEHHSHGHNPHGHHPHGHRPHGHHPHGHHPHGHRPHGHHPHGHRPHGHYPHGHAFHDYGPCDPPPHSKGSQDHHHHGHGPPHRHSEERGPGKGHFPFHWRRIGYIYRLPPLEKGEVLPLPEANFPSFSLPDHDNLLKPFPQSASESCPGTFKVDFPQVSKFFAYSSQK